MKNRNIVSFLQNKFGNITDSSMSDQMVTVGDLEVDPGQLLTMIPQLLSAIKEGKAEGEPFPVSLDDFADNTFPVAVPLRNLSSRTSHSVSVRANAGDALRQYLATQASVPTRQYIMLEELTVVGGDTVPAGFNDFFAVAIGAASPLRTAVAAFAVQIRAIDTQSNSASFAVQLPGISSPFRYDLDDPTEVAEILIYPNSPIYEGAVNSSDGATLVFSNPSNPNLMRLGYDATTTVSPEFVVAAAPADLVMGFAGTNVKISVLPLYPTGKDLPAYMTALSEG